MAPSAAPRWQSQIHHRQTTGRPPRGSVQRAGTFSKARAVAVVKGGGRGGGESSGSRCRSRRRMKKGKGYSLLSNSFKIISSCLKTVSSNADTIASMVRSASASATTTIFATSSKDQKDQGVFGEAKAWWRWRRSL